MKPIKINNSNNTNVGQLKVYNEGSTRVLSIDTGGTVHYVQEFAIAKSNIVKNSLGLYSFQRPDKNGKVKFATLSGGKHMLSSGNLSCDWNPKGNVKSNLMEYSLERVQVNAEQCPGELASDCLEAALGTGNDARDFVSTPEGAALFSELIRVIFLGLGNSLYNLLHYGQNELITNATDNDLYDVDDAEWEEYVDQQNILSGILTQADDLAAGGLDHWNVKIKDSNISGDHKTYTGTVTDLFDEVIDAMPGKMKRAGAKPIIRVTENLFRKYKQELTLQFNTIPAILQYFMTADYAKSFGYNPAVPVSGVLEYDGYWIVVDEDWKAFDEMVGSNSFRIFASTPGLFGVGFDVEDVKQFDGQGLRIVQWLAAPHQGKIYMDTTFKTNVKILNSDYGVYANKVFTA